MILITDGLHQTIFFIVFIIWAIMRQFGVDYISEAVVGSVFLSGILVKTFAS